MLLSPVNTKLGCCPVVLAALVPLVLGDDGRRSIQGTATCLPPVLAEPALVPPTALLPPKPLELEDVPLGEVPVEELVPLGLVAAPVLLLEALSERTAKSMRPEPGLTIRSLIVPISLPELLVICAPVN